MHKIYTVYDKKAQSYYKPFYYPNKGLALRALGELVADPQTSLNKYPADFSIWYIGTWDETTGVIVPLQKPEFIDEASNCVQKNGA